MRSRLDRRRVLAVLAGLSAAAVALGVGQLVAALVGPASAPVVAVANAAIPLTPRPVKDFAVSSFGTSDKLALVIGALIVIALYAAVLGLLALHDRRLGIAGVAVFGLVGAVAATRQPAGRVLDAVPSVVSALVGALALPLVVAPLHRAPTPGARVVEAENPIDRRRFLLASGVTVGLAAVAAGAGQYLGGRFDVARARAALRLPSPASPAPALPAGADLAPEIPGLTPLFTTADAFYRIDTAIIVPQVSPENYRLRVTGMVDRPRTVNLQELYGRPDLIERDITLTCVSNEVGGGLVGTARWLGVPLGTFLRECGVQLAATQLVCRSQDGMTIGAATHAALTTPDAMLAIGMNGRPLPAAHGFPVRMIIPGFYGYVSACKWLTSIEVTTFESYDAYWVQRGWSRQGPIQVESRIDTPTDSRSFPAGRRAIAGVAWAQGRGISAVEVQVDAQPWQPAQLSPATEPDIWRQWRLPYRFPPGTHRIAGGWLGRGLAR